MHDAPIFIDYTPSNIQVGIFATHFKNTRGLLETYMFGDRKT